MINGFSSTLYISVHPKNAIRVFVYITCIAIAIAVVCRTIEMRLFTFSIQVNSQTTFERNLQNNRRYTKRVQSTSFIMSHLRMTD